MIDRRHSSLKLHKLHKISDKHLGSEPAKVKFINIKKNLIKISFAKVDDTLAEGQNISLGSDILIPRRSKYFSICWPLLATYCSPSTVSSFTSQTL